MPWRAAGGDRQRARRLDDSIALSWERDGLFKQAGSIKLHRATPLVGESTYDAFLGAQARQVHHDDP
jgi:hypothetical protein